MKKFLILALALIASVAFVAVAAAEDMTYTGWVADEACAKDFSKAGNEAHVGLRHRLPEWWRRRRTREPGRLPPARPHDRGRAGAPGHGSHGNGHPRRGDQHDHGDLDQRRRANGHLTII